MDAPEYLICLNCESPCYVFEWLEGEVTEALCTVCGDDDTDDFATLEEFEAMAESDGH